MWLYVFISIGRILVNKIADLVYVLLYKELIYNFLKWLYQFPYTLSNVGEFKFWQSLVFSDISILAILTDIKRYLMISIFISLGLTVLSILPTSYWPFIYILFGCVFPCLLLILSSFYYWVVLNVLFVPYNILKCQIFYVFSSCDFHFFL